MQQYSKTCLQTSDVKTKRACHRRFKAKSDVNSMNNIQAPGTFFDQCLLPNLF